MQENTISSAVTVKAVEYGEVNLSKYAMVDLLLGNEKDDGHSLLYYKTFKPSLRQQLTKYLNGRGKLFVSGSYLASDMQGTDEQDWLRNNLKITFDSANPDNYNSIVTGMGMSFDVYRTITNNIMVLTRQITSNLPTTPSVH